MDALGIIAIINAVLGAASTAVNFGKDVAPYFEIIKNDILGKPASEVDQAAIEAKIAELSADIQKPLDAEEPDET